MIKIILSLIVASLLGCQSSKKNTATVSSAQKSVSSTGEKMTKPSEKANLCRQRPAPTVCCEALTPTCNECRSNNGKIQTDWEKLCKKEPKPKEICKKPPPVNNCCPEYTPECSKCRKKSAAELLAWKSTCGTYEAHSCDSQPPISMCCQAMIPACQQCKQRNHRVQQEWTQRCKKAK